MKFFCLFFCSREKSQRGKVERYLRLLLKNKHWNFFLSLFFLPHSASSSCASSAAVQLVCFGFVKNKERKKLEFAERRHDYYVKWDSNFLAIFFCCCQKTSYSCILIIIIFDYELDNAAALTEKRRNRVNAQLLKNKSRLSSNQRKKRVYVKFYMWDEVNSSLFTCHINWIEFSSNSNQMDKSLTEVAGRAAQT